MKYKMAKSILYSNKDFIFSKEIDKRYSICFYLANDNIILPQIIDFDFISLTYKLNSDIYESVNLEKHNENEATILVVVNNGALHAFFVKRYMYMKITKRVENNTISFHYKPITDIRPSTICKEATIAPIKEIIVECKILHNHKIAVACYTQLDDNMELPKFIEKIISKLFVTIFTRVKQFTESFKLT
jgi:hypothetical protein